MHGEDRKIFGIWSCVIVGCIIVLASLLFSKVDQQTIQGNTLDDFGEGWHITVGHQSYTNVQVPAQIKDATLGDTIVLDKRLPSDIDQHTYLFFRASHQNVKVYIGDKLIYHFGWDEQRLFSKSPACNWVAVPLKQEQSNQLITIELTGIYNRYAGLINDISIGDKSAIIQQIISSRLGSIFICLTLTIIGMGMIAITFALRKHKITASLSRLGILATLIGIWSLCVTNTLQTIYGNVYVLLNLEFFIFNLLLPVFMWFLLSFQHYEEQRWMHGLYWVSIAQFMSIQILQIFHIADYMQSIIMTHIMIAIAIGLIIFTGITDLIRHHAKREESIFVFSVMLLLVFVCMDLIRFYQVTLIDEGFYTRIGTLIFIGIWALEVMRTMSKRFVNMAKTEALEVLAYVDLMTGLKNRTAFEERLSSATENDNYFVIAFDMNGLKEINDNFGHVKGDQAIIAVSHAIKHAYEPDGISYRIGGDEICVILSKLDSDKINKWISLLAQVESAIKKEGGHLQIELSVAAGYAQTNTGEHKDIYRAYREADRQMYECKNKLKQRSKMNEHIPFS